MSWCFEMGVMLLSVWQWLKTTWIKFRGVERAFDKIAHDVMSPVSFGPDGTIHLGGEFINPDLMEGGTINRQYGLSVDHVAEWNTSSWDSIKARYGVVIETGDEPTTHWDGVSWEGVTRMCWFCGKEWNRTEYGTCAYCGGPESKERMGRVSERSDFYR